MFIATYDNQQLIPPHVEFFIKNTLIYDSLNFLCTSHNIKYLSNNFKKNNNINFINTDINKNIKKELDFFEKKYIHYSTKDYSKTCSFFKRWLVLNMCTEHLCEDEYICMLDNDLMIGMPLSNILTILSGLVEKKHNINFIAEWDLSSNFRIGPELSIMTKKILTQFCIFLQDVLYSDDMKIKLEDEFSKQLINRSGTGVNDMHALAFFSRYFDNIVTFNLREISDYGFIHNINEFTSESFQKNIDWFIAIEDSRQYLTMNSKKVQLIAIHFQGVAKKAIYNFYINKRIDNRRFLKITKTNLVTKLSMRLLHAIKL